VLATGAALAPCLAAVLPWLTAVAAAPDAVAVAARVPRAMAPAQNLAPARQPIGVLNICISVPGGAFGPLGRAPELSLTTLAAPEAAEKK
jgi:hypothetical protein